LLCSANNRNSNGQNGKQVGGGGLWPQQHVAKISRQIEQLVVFWIPVPAQSDVATCGWKKPEKGKGARCWVARMPEFRGRLIISQSARKVG